MSVPKMGLGSSPKTARPQVQDGAEKAPMVERVARAMWEVDAHPDMVWEDFRADYLPAARAAIEAMREPTEAMVKAPEGSFSPDTSEYIKQSWRDVYANHYRAMIDAILAEKGE